MQIVNKRYERIRKYNTFVSPAKKRLSKIKIVEEYIPD